MTSVSVGRRRENGGREVSLREKEKDKCRIFRSNVNKYLIKKRER